jgi:hypothetical protein
MPRAGRPGSIAPRLAVVGTGAAAPWDAADPGGDEIWSGAAGDVLARCRVEADGYRIDLPGVATFRLDPAGDRVVAIPHPGLDEAAVARAYWRRALPLVLHARGREVLHASAVRMAHGVVALCGVSGSGKSTIAYALHRRGWDLWADDALPIDVTPSGVDALSVPFEVRLRRRAAARFGLLDGAGSLAGGHRDAAPAALRAVCILARDPVPPGAGRLVRLGGRAAYPAILPHAYCFSLKDRARKRSMVERYLLLLARVPVFRLHVPPDLDGLPAVVTAVETTFGAPADGERRPGSPSARAAGTR